ncbi:hypothetical protein KAZ82_00595 [Candidatus Babeliales bacterium]|nr:hypothetical protein [Candidatus Babeliales bacterium]
MQKHIFRQSDIRGIIGIELMMHEIYPLMQAILLELRIHDNAMQRIAVGLDGRVHGQEIYQRVAQAIIEAGYQVDFLGICPTPVFEYALHQLPVQAGIMITASASPAEYNGFKIYLHKQLVQADVLQSIYQHYQSGLVANSVISNCHIGKIVPCPIINQYIDALWKEFAHLSEYDFSVVIDCGHGTTGPIIKNLIEKMHWQQVITICDVIDGAFPIHNPEPFDINNMKMLQSAIISNKKSFGVSFDGDGDRMIVFDQFGNMILGDVLSSLFLNNIFQKYAQKSLVCDQQVVQGLRLNTVLHQNQIGIARDQSAILKIFSQQKNVIFGSQMHGRFFFKDRHAGYADGIYAFLRLLDILIKERKSLDELLTDLSLAQLLVLGQASEYEL